MSSSEKIDFFEVSDLTSLICTDPSVGDVVRATLRELNFKFHTADSMETGIERIRYNLYDIIVLQDNFAGSSLKSNAILSYLAPLAMAQRRYSMVVLIGGGLKTFDAMEAFGNSVQLVVSTSDLPNFSAILKKSWTGFQSMYRIYTDVFASMGEK